MKLTSIKKEVQLNLFSKETGVDVKLVQNPFNITKKRINKI